MCADPWPPPDAVTLPLEDCLDLHTFRPQEVRDVVAEYIHQAARAGFVEVRIVHGRGQGVQRAAVRKVLARSPEVAAFADAPAARGGWGATLVQLRAPQTQRASSQEPEEA